MPPYKHIRNLGEGAFGKVTLNSCPPNVPFWKEHARVAIKCIKDPGENAEAEVNILKQLDHKGIVKYLASYTDSSTLCIVMEYCDQGKCSPATGLTLF